MKSKEGVRELDRNPAHTSLSFITIMATGSSITTTSLSASFNSPPTDETNMEVCKLSCLVDGDPRLFMVKAHPDIILLEFVSLVYAQKDKGILKGINASDIILWKVSSSQKLA